MRIDLIAAPAEVGRTTARKFGFSCIKLDFGIDFSRRLPNSICDRLSFFRLKIKQLYGLFLSIDFNSEENYASN